MKIVKNVPTSPAVPGKKEQWVCRPSEGALGFREAAQRDFSTSGAATAFLKDHPSWVMRYEPGTPSKEATLGKITVELTPEEFDLLVTPSYGNKGAQIACERLKQTMRLDLHILQERQRADQAGVRLDTYDLSDVGRWRTPPHRMFKVWLP